MSNNPSLRNNKNKHYLPGKTKYAKFFLDKKEKKSRLFCDYCSIKQSVDVKKVFFLLSSNFSEIKVWGDFLFEL